MEKKYIYDAFISYRHTELDKFVAENLHKQLEAFKLPGNISKKKTGRTRIERIFRDKDELPLTSNLEDPILQALQNSEYLIVICSPRLRESLWCKKEIETFIHLHGREKILAVLIEGEPDESFPEELLYVEELVKHEDGTEEIVKKPMEPLAADIRGKDKKAMLKAMRTEMLRLLAPMFSLNYDDLRQRHRERRMKRILTASLIGAAVCLIFGTVSTTMALRIHKQKEQIEAQNMEIQAQNDEIQAQNDEIQAQNEEIQNQNRILTENQAIVLAEEAVAQLENGDRIGAINTAVTALTEYEGITMPYTAEAQYALTESLHVYDTDSYIKPYYQMETEGYIDFVKLSPDGQKMLTGDSAGSITLWDVTEGAKIFTLTDLDLTDKLKRYENTCAFIGNDKVICIDETGRAMVFAISEEESIKTESSLGIGFLTDLGEEKADSVYGDEAGRYFMVEHKTGISVYSADTLEVAAEYIPEEKPAFSGDFFFDEEGKYLAFGEEIPQEDDEWSWRSNLQVRFLNIQENSCSQAMPIGLNYLQDVCFADGRAFLLCAANSDDISHNEATLLACNPENVSVYWKNTYEGEFGKCLYCTHADGVKRVLMITTYAAYAVERADGRDHGRIVLGSSIVGGTAFANSDMYILFTRDGKYNVVNGETMEGYNFSYLFQCHSQNVEEFLILPEGFLVISSMDNRVTYYKYSAGIDVVKTEEEFTVREAEIIYVSEAVEIATQIGSEKAGLALHAFYNEDNTLLGISYTDDTLEIYRTSDSRLMCKLSNISYSVTRFTGTDAAGNVYVDSGVYGYMFNPDMEYIARIEGLVAVDAAGNRLFLADTSGNLFTVPIYTVEELLAKAEPYVLR
ncbi:MAG: TIR domain-containing protein [Lachnospiraceae bacterium]